MGAGVARRVRKGRFHHPQPEHPEREVLGDPGVGEVAERQGVGDLGEEAVSLGLQGSPKIQDLGLIVGAVGEAALQPLRKG